MAAFLWAQRSGQFGDLEGSANRILFDEDDNPAEDPKEAVPEDHKKEKGLEE